MSKIGHLHAQKLIQATMGDAISGTEKENLTRHLDDCAACREYASQMDALEGVLRRNFHTRWDSTRGPSSRVVDTIYMRTKTDHRFKKFSGFAKAAVVVGCLAFIAFIALILSSGQSEPLSFGQITQTPTIETPQILDPLAETITPAITSSAPGQGDCTSRAETITYTVQPGDTIAAIAEQYCLNPATIYWTNYDLLIKNNNALVPGIVIDIPADDGDFIWAPSSEQAAPGSTSQSGSGVCQVTGSNSTGTGTFIWPTELHFISGEDYAPALNQFGIDLAGSSGDPVYASDSGVVLFAGWSNWGYGNMVVIDHGNGKQTLYAYLSSVDVACGEQIVQGRLIGKIGATGKATGPSLHFEIIVDNDHVNPLEYLP